MLKKATSTHLVGTPKDWPDLPKDTKDLPAWWEKVRELKKRQEDEINQLRAAVNKLINQ